GEGDCTETPRGHNQRTSFRLTSAGAAARMCVTAPDVLLTEGVLKAPEFQEGVIVVTRGALGLALLLASALRSTAAEDTAELLKQVRSVGPRGAGSPAARAAWERLVARGPAVLP